MVSDIRIERVLKAGGRLAVTSPDRNASQLQGEHWTGRTLEAALPKLNIYSVIAITPR